MPSLDARIREGATADDVAAFLDGLSPEARLAEILAVSRRSQADLFERCAGRAATLATDFVPPGTAPLAQVIHEGRNTLAPGFRYFQKRFARSIVEPDVAVGYNEQTFRLFTGPGYFVAREAEHESGVKTVVVDYTRLPRDRDPSWPPIIPNSSRLGFLIYNGTQDWMWRVSSHVTIGRARRKSGWMDNWFVLCRT